MLRKQVTSGFWACCLWGLCIALQAQDYILEAALPAGGPGLDLIRCICPDSSGNIYACGSLSFPFHWGTTILEEKAVHSAFLSKTVSGNNLEWLLLFHSPEEISLNTLCIGPNQNLFLTGSFSDTLFFPEGILVPENGMAGFAAEADTCGNILRCFILFPRLRGLVTEALFLPDGKLLTCGEFENRLEISDTLLRSRGKKDIFLALFDTGENLHSLSSFGGKSNDTPAGLCLTPNGFALGGNFSRSICLNDTCLQSAGKEDCFIAFFRPEGKLVSCFRTGNEGNDHLNDICQGSSPYLWGTGYSENPGRTGHSEFSDRKNFFLVRTDSSLNFKEILAGASPYEDEGILLAEGASGSIFFSLLFEGIFSIGPFSFACENKHPDILLGRICQGDSVCWIRQLEGPKEEYPYSLAYGPDEKLYLAGNFSGEAALENKLSAASEGKELFLLCFSDPCKKYSLDLGPDRILCQGHTDTLRVPESFVSYSWNGGQWEDPVWPVDKPGIYTLETQSDYGCIYRDTLILQEGILELFSLVTNEIIPPGKNGSVALEISGNHPPYHIEWSTGDTSSALYNLRAGPYQVKVTDSAGCYAETEMEVLAEAASYIDLRLEPNPYADLSQVSYTLSFETQVRLQLIDQNGSLRKILYEGHRLPGSYSFTLNRQSLSSGIYLLQLITEKIILTRKVIITGNP